MPGAQVLVVANRTGGSEELLAALVERHGQGSISGTLVAPARWEETEPHDGEQAALRRLRTATDRLREAGIEAEGGVGNADPFTAVEENWNPERFEEIIVCTLPERLSRWLRLDLPSRVERLTGRHVHHVVGHKRTLAGNEQRVRPRDRSLGQTLDTPAHGAAALGNFGGADSDCRYTRVGQTSRTPLDAEPRSQESRRLNRHAANACCRRPGEARAARRETLAYPGRKLAPMSRVLRL